MVTQKKNRSVMTCNASSQFYVVIYVLCFCICVNINAFSLSCVTCKGTTDVNSNVSIYTMACSFICVVPIKQKLNKQTKMSEFPPLNRKEYTLF